MSMRITGSPFPSQSKAHFSSQILQVPSHDFKGYSFQKPCFVSPVMPQHPGSNTIGANAAPISRQLDFTLSPMQQLKDISKAHTNQDRTITSESERSTGRPSIQPVSCQHLTRSSTQRLGESAVLDFERKSSKGQNKENVASSLNLRDNVKQQYSLMLLQLKEKTAFLSRQLIDIEKNNPKLANSLQFLHQIVENIQTTYQQVKELLTNLYQLFDQLTLWRNRCLELEGRSKTESQEYAKLKGIMESLQQKTTVLVEENSRLNAQLLRSDSTSETRYKVAEKEQQIEQVRKQLLEVQEEKEEMGRRFAYEREQMQEQHSQIQHSQNQHLFEVQQQYQQQIQQLQSQLQQASRELTMPNCSVISDKNNRETAYKLEQAEMKLLTLQISHDNIKQELQHKNLDYKTIENLKDTLGILNTKIQELIHEKELLNQEIDNANERIMQLQSQIQRMEQMSNSEITSLKSQLQSVSDSKRQVEGQLRSQVQLSDQLQERCYKLEEQLNFLSKEAEAERGRNASEISRLGGVLDQARREGDQMQKALSYLKCEKEELESRRSQEVSGLQAQLQRASQQCNAVASELQQWRGKYGQLVEGVAELRERMESRRMEEDSARVVGQAERQLLETQVQNLSDKCSENEQTIIALEHKARSLENRAAQFAGVQEQVRFEQSRNEELKKQSQELLSQLSAAQRQIEELGSVKDQLAWKAEHLGSELGRRTRDFGEKSEELKLLARKQEEAAKTIEKLERKLMEKIEAESRCGEMSLEKLRF